MANFDSCAPCPMEMELENLHVVRAVSPTAAAEEIPGGHRVTITDWRGQTVFTVLDGPAQFAETDSAGQDSGFTVCY